MNHEKHFVIKGQIQERMRDAERERLARSVAAKPKIDPPWHARLTLAVVRRLAGVAEAS
jgi:hypothetical protein